jgi:uncharacterized phage protein gp47/JayE
MTFGLTPYGFNAKRLADIKQELENAFIAQFGDINTDPQSVSGQIIGVFSKSFADIWENLEEVYFSQYPNSASGVSLDNVVQLNGISRLPATQTSVVATCDGAEGSYVPFNSLARINLTNETFYALTGGTITRSNADIVKIQVDSVTTQQYTVVLSNQSFIHSLPTITFSNIGAIFVASNSIVVTLNGVQLAAVPYNTSSNQTLADLATAIQAFDSSLSCTASATNPDIIEITPLTGKNVTVNSISITGGATQASYVVTYRAPANQNAITSALTALINVGTPSWLCVDHMDGTFTITANDPSLPFSCNVGVNLSVIYQASPIIFVAENFGPVACPIGTLTTIVTPIAGWNSINNVQAGVTGRFIETDAELRIRRQNSIKLLGLATVEAIRSRLLQQVLGVTSALVFENRTLQQEPILIVFADVFNSGDTISVTYDTINTFTVPFNTNQATTMTDLVNAFEAIPEVLSASHGGSGDKTVTILMRILEVITVNSVTTDVSAQTASIKGGRPPKSFEAIVEGGSNNDIANKIWQTKPAGIQTFGNTSATITDSQGNSQVIYFSRPTPIYVWVQVALTLYTEESFPTNGLQSVAEAINNYGNSLGVGVDVLFQRVLAQIFQVPGIASGNMQIASTALATNSPSFSTSDITVGDNEISIFDLQRISVTVV